MSAKATQADDGTEFQNIDEDIEKSIRASLSSHRFLT